jgi:hydroxymethylpyrimidine/phosphomethylpyrimidine kinase
MAGGVVSIPVVLTIAGSDSGGGAGIQADLKTFDAFRVFGTTAVTAVTVQNTTGVQGVHLIPVGTIRAQIHAVVEDLHPLACKTGMLGSDAIVSAVAHAIRESAIGSYVLDPVMVATSGDRLLDAGAEQAIVRELLPLATIITPNLDEAAILAGMEVRTVAQMETAARSLAERGARAVLVKGGHLEGDRVIDVFYDGAAMHSFDRARIDTRHTHGTGCTLSAAITAELALGRDLLTAVGSALDYVHRAIENAPNLGQGSGPLNHFVPRPQLSHYPKA